MLRPSGVVIEFCHDTGRIREIETFMCKHCNRHTVLWNRQRLEDLLSGPWERRKRPEDVDGDFCHKCGGRICKQCRGKGCDPLEKKIQRAIDQHYYRTRIQEW